MKLRLSPDKAFDLIGKIGLMLITGGVGGAVFTHKVPVALAVGAVLTGIICVTIGSLETDGSLED